MALTICTIIVVLITVGGGLVSVAYSDAVSALIMIGGFFIAIRSWSMRPMRKALCCLLRRPPLPAVCPAGRSWAISCLPWL